MRSLVNSSLFLVKVKIHRQCPNQTGLIPILSMLKGTTDWTLKYLKRFRNILLILSFLHSRSIINLLSSRYNVIS